MSPDDQINQSSTDLVPVSAETRAGYVGSCDCDCGAKPRTEGQIVKATTRRFPQGRDVKLFSKVAGTSCWLCKYAEGHTYTHILESEMSASILPASHYA